MNRGRSRRRHNSAVDASDEQNRDQASTTQSGHLADERYSNDPVDAAGPGGLAGIRVINASPDTVLDACVDGTRCFFQVSYGQLTTYARVGAGIHSLRTSVRDPSGRESKLEMTISLHADAEYTVALVGEPAELEQIITKDTTAPPKPGRVRVRAWNLAQGIGPIDMFTGDGVDIFRNVDYKEITGFAEINAGRSDLHFRRSGDGVTIFTVEGIVLESTGRYTFIVLAKSGLKGPFNVVPVQDSFSAAKVPTHQAEQ